MYLRWPQNHVDNMQKHGYLWCLHGSGRSVKYVWVSSYSNSLCILKWHSSFYMLRPDWHLPRQIWKSWIKRKLTPICHCTKVIEFQRGIWNPQTVDPATSSVRPGSCLSGQSSMVGTRSDDAIKLNHFPSYWSFVRGIRRSPVNSPHKGQWRGALMFSLICAWIKS